MVYCRQIDRHRCVRRVNLTCKPIVPSQVSVITKTLISFVLMAAGRGQRKVDRADTPGLELQRAEAVSRLPCPRRRGVAI